MPTYTFTREERLKSRKLLGQLFKAGNAFVAYPLRVVWVDVTDAPSSTAVAISVPKRAFKTAVARNRLKRRIREAYRLHKHELYEKLGDRRVALLLMFIAKEELPFAAIEAGVVKMVRKFPV